MSQPAVPAHIRVSVPQSALQRGQLGAPSQLRAVLEHLKPRRRVSIEAHEHAAPTAVLYAPDIAPTTGHPYTPTEFVAVHPVASSGSLVHAHEAFEIRVVGLIAAPHDALGDHNELLVYSLCADPGGQDEVPYVHLAPDDPGASAPPGQFVPVPSSKALFLAHRGEPRREIFCRFAVAEVDEVGEAATAAIEGIGQLGSFAQQFGASIPHFGMLSPAVHLASLVGKNALDSYAKNDSVLDTDFRFLLAGAGEGLDPETSAINGDFLRVRNAAALARHYHQRYSHTLPSAAFSNPLPPSITFALPSMVITSSYLGQSTAHYTRRRACPRRAYL